MQLRLKPRNTRTFINRNLIVKTILIISVLFLGVFLIDKINLPAPNELIKQEISNDKLITLK
jgi:hypothetical protein